MEPVKLTPEQWSLYKRLEGGERAILTPLAIDLVNLGAVVALDTHLELNPVECKLECLQWRRESNGKLCLYVFENNKWVRYRDAQHYRPDATISSHSGFATSQQYLRLGYTFRKTVEKDADE